MAQPNHDNATEAKLTAAIRDAITRRARLWVTFNNFRRLIEPYRLWRQPDGTYLLESHQNAGGSGWGDMHAEGFTPSPLGGYEAWINMPLEKIGSIAPAGGPFTPRDDYNPDPVRVLGEVIEQVQIPAATASPGG
ncbi:MAG: hypothetical protein H6810_06140 [Phycisphaeraceae bacterium]|nr:MAG: hypothetical protein H6810_06140 [Phycisphaeraceae bacterium]